MDTAPLLILNPVRSSPTGMQLIVPGRPPIPMLRGSDPIHGFNPGWRAESLFTLFDPVWLLLLQHESGETGCWYIGSSGGITNMPQDYTGPELPQFRNRLQSVALWMRMVPGARIRVPAPAAALLYAALPEAVQREIDPVLEPAQVALLQQAVVRQAQLPGASLSPEAPPLVFEQSRAGSGPGAIELRIGNPGRLTPVTTGDRTILVPPGWRVTAVHAQFAPLLTVILRHDSGARSSWFTDLDGRLLGVGTGGLSAELQDHVASFVAPVFEDLWTSLVLGDGPSTTPPDIHIGELALDELAELAPAHLRRLRERQETRILTLEEPATLALEARIPTGSGARTLDPNPLARALSHSLPQELDRLLESGRMLWPSPIDGRMIESDGFALLLGPRSFAYRFRDRPARLVFYVIQAGDHPGAAAIWFPGADLLVADTARRAADCHDFRRARPTILRHLLRLGPALLDGARRPVDPTIQDVLGAPSDDLGRHVHDDLAGTASLLRAVAGHRRLPNLHLFGTRQAAPLLGPVERIFPMFTGRVGRHEQDFEAASGMFYRRNQRVIRYLPGAVPAEFGRTVIAAAGTTPGLEATRQAADAARAADAPLVLLGLGSGSGDLTEDLAALLLALIPRLGETWPGCTIVLDGSHDAANRGRAVNAPSGSRLDREYALADRLVAEATAAQLHVVDNVNRSALTSVLWCSRGDAFLAPFGDALAIYRWICNTPGIVLPDGKAGSDPSDLHIYRSAEYMETPSELLSADADEDAGTLVARFIGLVSDRLASRLQPAGS